MESNIKKLGQILITVIFLFFSYLLLQLSLPYLSFDNRIAFLGTKQDVIHIDAWRLSFYLHVFSSIFVLLAGFFQFFKFSFQRHLKFHRFLGKFYIILILFVSGPSGLLMAFYANGGIWTKLGFVLLGIGWLVFTALAYYYIRQRNIEAHRNFMIRSYAFTLSAITLRGWMFIFSWFYMDYHLSYLIVAWLSWCFNLGIAEYLIFQRKKLKSSDDSAKHLDIHYINKKY